MEVAYYDWGGIKISSNELDMEVQKIYQACQDNTSCEIIEARKNTDPQNQTIIVEFADGSFDANNPAGIFRVERLALTPSPNSASYWDVRALRKNFPVTMHQNYVLEGEPCSLCLYVEPWQSVIRSWTPQLFIQRIFWWLRETAEGSIHRDDQPIEHLFFSSAYNVLLPENHFDMDANTLKKLFFAGIPSDHDNTVTLIGSYSHDNSRHDAPSCVSISVLVESVGNGAIEKYPYTLGQLQESLSQRGGDI